MVVGPGKVRCEVAGVEPLVEVVTIADSAEVEVDGDGGVDLGRAVVQVPRNDPVRPLRAKRVRELWRRY